jgi:hypothetical protein
MTRLIRTRPTYGRQLFGGTVVPGKFRTFFRDGLRAARDAMAPFLLIAWALGWAGAAEAANGSWSATPLHVPMTALCNGGAYGSIAPYAQPKNLSS